MSLCVHAVDGFLCVPRGCLACASMCRTEFRLVCFGISLRACVCFCACEQNSAARTSVEVCYSKVGAWVWHKSRFSQGGMCVCVLVCVSVRKA